MEFHFKRAFETLGPSLLDGVGVVIYVTLVGFSLSLIVALLLALGRLSKIKPLVRILSIFIEIIRGTPLLVQFFYIYYVVQIFINGISDMLGFETHMQIQAVTAGIIGFAINYGCYISEVIRSAIVAIDPGQREAGLALGFSEKQVMLYFIIPAALRNSIPVFGNYLVMMVKDTSLLAMITVQELLLRTKTYASQTFLTVESYTILALMYLVISLPLSKLCTIIERRLKQSK